ncbi:hypothetical protein IT402_01820 [Candidatus Nomurabacteria bacterium]|nr:hypothetical protein [Candidatus Nomurabacteria bacterium]
MSRKYYVIVKVLIGLIIVLSLFLLWFIVLKNHFPHRDEKAHYIKVIGKHVILPKGEDPQLMKISNNDTLTSQQFFNGSSDGDIVLFYAKSRKAILYSVAERKLLNVADLTLIPRPQDGDPNSLRF